MKLKYKITLILLLIAVTCVAVYFINNQTQDLGPVVFKKNNSQTTGLSQTPNKINAIYRVSLSDLEKDQVVKSVDAFMNEFKLPKGDFQNSYTLLVERRLKDAMRVVTDPEQTKNDTHAIIYLRKVEGIWQVDRNAGPWCTLEEFEQRNCQQ